MDRRHIIINDTMVNTREMIQLHVSIFSYLFWNVDTPRNYALQNKNKNHHNRLIHYYLFCYIYLYI